MVRAQLLATLLIVLLGAGCLDLTVSDSAHQNNGAANRLFAQGRYTDALQLYREAQVSRPDLPQLDFNAGSTLHKLGEYERALRQLQRALAAADPRLQATTHYNMGNTFYMLDHFEEAIEEYKKALRVDPSDMDAKHNIEYLQRLLDERRQKKPEEQAQDPSAGRDGQDSDQKSGNQDQENQGSQGGRGNSQQGQGERRTPETQSRDLKRMIEEAGQDMSIEDALRILDVLREREQELRGSLNWDARPGNGARQERDW